MKSHGLFLLMIGGMLWLMGGCNTAAYRPLVAQTPVPTGYHLSTQHKMQAAQHWEKLARDVASDIQHSIYALFPDQFPIFNRALFVAASGLTPFEKGFQELLITGLVEKGFLVTRNPNDALILSFELQLITHSDRYIRNVSQRPAGRYLTLVPGFQVSEDTPLTGRGRQTKATQNLVRSAEVYAEAGVYTRNLPRNEVLITISLTEGEAFIYRNSVVYYINDADWWHYRLGTQRPQPAVATFNLIDR